MLLDVIKFIKLTEAKWFISDMQLGSMEYYCSVAQIVLKIKTWFFVSLK